MITVSIILAVLYVIYNVIQHRTDQFLGCDFICYREAANGNFTWKPQQSPNGFAGGCYAKPLATLWKPLLKLSEKSGMFIWILFLIIIYIIFLSFLMKLPYAWILILLSIKPFTYVIRSGNVAPILALLCIDPIGTIIACVFKPYLFPIFIIHQYRNQLETWIEACIK